MVEPDPALAAAHVESGRIDERAAWRKMSKGVQFADFYRANMPRLVSFLRLQGVPLTDAADIAQEVMIDAYRQWDQIAYPKTWTYRVASRKWARRIGDAERRGKNLPVPEGQLLITESNIDQWEDERHIIGMLDQLSSRQRQVLAWSMSGYNSIEIANELKMTPEAVRTNLKLARRAIAVLLKESRDDK